MRTFRRLLGFLRPYRRTLIVSLVLAWAAMGMTVAIPWLVGEAVDAIQRGDRPDLLPLALGWLYALAMAAAAQDPAASAGMEKGLAEQGRQMAAEVALYLAGRGYDVTDIREVRYAVSAARVRYFFASDREQAEQIAAYVDRYLIRATDAKRRAHVQDYTRYRPLPARGNKEVWIASGTAFQRAE